MSDFNLEQLLKESIVRAKLSRLSERIDRVLHDVEEHRIGYRLARYRRRLLMQDHTAIEQQAREWDVLR